MVYGEERVVKLLVKVNAALFSSSRTDMIPAYYLQSCTKSLVLMGYALAVVLYDNMKPLFEHTLATITATWCSFHLPSSGYLLSFDCASMTTSLMSGPGRVTMKSVTMAQGTPRQRLRPVDFWSTMASSLHLQDAEINVLGEH